MIIIEYKIICQVFRHAAKDSNSFDIDAIRPSVALEVVKLFHYTMNANIEGK